jgi:hypothetical protein
MRSLGICYYKRFRMEIPLAGLAAPAWPAGYRALPWNEQLFDYHAETLHYSFKDEIDSGVFPAFLTKEGCLGLIRDIVRRPAFIPEATWLVLGPDGPCGTVQALRERGVLGAIQNVGILPDSRGLGLGKALVLQSLAGMYASGLGRAKLEVTADNSLAIRMYQRIGFQRAKVVYKAVPVFPFSANAEDNTHLIF